MIERGAHTLAEITSQPTVWETTLHDFRTQTDAFEALWHDHSFDRVIFTGCGSTYYLSIIGATLFQTVLGIPAQAYPASQIALFPDTVFLPNTKPLLITVSRSGETTETIQATRIFRQKTGNPMVSVTCYGDSALAQDADVVLVASAAQEQSIAQTRSFASMTILIEAMVGALAGQDKAQLDALVPTVTRLLADYHDLARRLGEDSTIEKFFFLGSGFLYGIANEAMLKMKEMSLSYSEAFHMLEFRHGPMSMVDEKTLVVGLISEDARAQEEAVLREMKGRGAQILALSESDYGMNLAEWSHFVPVQSGLPQWTRTVAYLPILQLMAYYRAIARGQNPDQPANLEAVIVLSLESLELK